MPHSIERPREVPRRNGESPLFYLAILVPDHGGGWSVLFPDFPGCATYGSQARDAMATAVQVIAHQLAVARTLEQEVPPPMSYEAIRSDSAWARDRGIDWSTAVVTVLPFLN